jgi:hypothetical protein
MDGEPVNLNEKMIVKRYTRALTIFLSQTFDIDLM